MQINQLIWDEGLWERKSLSIIYKILFQKTANTVLRLWELIVALIDPDLSRTANAAPRRIVPPCHRGDDGNRASSCRETERNYLFSISRKSSAVTHRRRSYLATRNRDGESLVAEVGARHKGESGTQASKGMRESASNHEFNAFYRGSPASFSRRDRFP